MKIISFCAVTFIHVVMEVEAGLITGVSIHTLTLEGRLEGGQVNVCGEARQGGQEGGEDKTTPPHDEEDTGEHGEALYITRWSL